MLFKSQQPFQACKRKCDIWVTNLTPSIWKRSIFEYTFICSGFDAKNSPPKRCCLFLNNPVCFVPIISKKTRVIDTSRYGKWHRFAILCRRAAQVKYYCKNNNRTCTTKYDSLLEQREEAGITTKFWSSCSKVQIREATVLKFKLYRLKSFLTRLGMLYKTVQRA